MTALYQRDQFSGAILVASHGHVLYENAFGMANREKHHPFKLNTHEYIGSVSKQLTALGIMILHDRGKLSYDQPIKDIFPELPACMQPVTIRNLLYHTSGLTIFDDYPNITEQDAFKLLLAQKELQFKPGEKFEYCNTGYSLLGMIIEKVSGQSLSRFMSACPRREP
jgi:CubicO group peptidase (beta-lactamase class C family)